MTTGSVRKVISDRGFGFIAGDDGKDYFFHRNALAATLEFDRLAEGQKVQFEIEQDPKGARARNVEAA
jgi:CspA family cold shock protein